MNAESVRVLVADDEPAVLALIRALLEEEGCEFECASDGEEALKLLEERRPDVLITDLKMPRMNGEELLTRARSLYPDITVLVETGYPSVECAVRLLRGGAFDFVAKPFQLEEFEDRLRAAIRESRRQRRASQAEAVVETLLGALESKDPYLRGHSRRVARLARRLGYEMGLSARRLDVLEWAALVHDVGKIGVPEEILHKRGPLTPREMEVMRKHPRYSVEILRPLFPFHGGKTAEAAVYHHHERMDGLGYPEGLRAEAIPFEARIIAVCDAYDAMASERPYRAPLPPEIIREEILKASGTQLDSRIAERFLGMLDSVPTIQVREEDAARCE